MQVVAPPTEPQLYRTILEGANAIQVWNLARSAMGNSPNELRRCLAEAAESLALLQRDCTATLHSAYLEGATSFEDFIARTRKAQEQVSGRIARLADHPQVQLSPRVSLVFRGQGPFDSAALEFGNTVFSVILPPSGSAQPGGPRPPGLPQP